MSGCSAGSTCLPGCVVFAVGDVRAGSVKRVAYAVGEVARDADDATQAAADVLASGLETATARGPRARTTRRPEGTLPCT
ncbi:MAG TPA: hypothetical protein VGL81_27950 [Polyangiaceae bacterium]